MSYGGVVGGGDETDSVREDVKAFDVVVVGNAGIDTNVYLSRRSHRTQSGDRLHRER
jgi:hypothetical protein